MVHQDEPKELRQIVAVRDVPALAIVTKYNMLHAVGPTIDPDMAVGRSETRF